MEDVRFLADRENPSYHPGRCAKVYCGDTPAGHAGAGSSPCGGATTAWMPSCTPPNCGFDALYRKQGRPAGLPASAQIPCRHPGHCRGVRQVRHRGRSWRTAIRKGARGPAQRRGALRHLHRRGHRSQGKKSVAFSLTLRADDRSLTAEEADEDVKSILESLRAECGAELR